jgi:hypothetical protein
MRRQVHTLFVALLLVFCAATSYAQSLPVKIALWSELEEGERPVPKRVAFFNMPVHADGSANKDSRLEDQIIKYIDALGKGADIHIAMYGFSSAPVIRALVKAARRGVRLHIIVNAKEQEAISALGPVSTDFRICGTADGTGTPCAGFPGAGVPGAGVNHNKFILFSSYYDSGIPFVIQSSANMTNNSLLNEFNNILILPGMDVYKAYRDHWTEMYTGTPTKDFQDVPSANLSLYFSPPLSPTRPDPIASALTAITECTPDTKIRILMGHWTQSCSRKAIAEELVRLKNLSCDVRVAVRKEHFDQDPGTCSGAPWQPITYLIASGVPVWIHPEIHSKYMLIQQGNSFQVWTGSHNFTNGALRKNHEVLVQLRDDKAIFEQYLENWEKVVKRSKVAPPSAQ